MVLCHKWDVKKGFAYVLQFFSLISDGLGSVWMSWGESRLCMWLSLSKVTSLRPKMVSVCVYEIQFNFFPSNIQKKLGEKLLIAFFQKMFRDNLPWFSKTNHHALQLEFNYLTLLEKQLKISRTLKNLKVITGIISYWKYSEINSRLTFRIDFLLNST